MKYASGPPRRWAIRLVSGAEIALWADGFEEVAGEYVFGNLVDATPDEQTLPHVEVTNRTPSNPARVVVTVARIPIDAVATLGTYAMEPGVEFGCDYCADWQNRLFGHVTQVASDESRRMILLQCPRCGVLYENTALGPDETRRLTVDEARRLYPTWAPHGSLE
jgi:hypothetical protein